MLHITARAAACDGTPTAIFPSTPYVTCTSRIGVFGHRHRQRRDESDRWICEIASGVPEALRTAAVADVHRRFDERNFPQRPLPVQVVAKDTTLVLPGQFRFVCGDYVDADTRDRPGHLTIHTPVVRVTKAAARVRVLPSVGNLRNFHLRQAGFVPESPFQPSVTCEFASAEYNLCEYGQRYTPSNHTRNS